MKILARSMMLSLGLLAASSAFARSDVRDGNAMVQPVKNVKFSIDGYWRGETHRLCDRPGLATRVLEEVAAAGVTQVVIVTAATPVSGPHRLAPPRLDVRSRLGDFTTAAEAAEVAAGVRIVRGAGQTVGLAG